MKATKYQLILLRPSRDLISLEDAASRAGLHPEVVRRWIDLGLLEPADGTSTSTRIMLRPEVLRRIRVIQRLHYDLGINLQGIAVILDLLDRLTATQQGGDRGH